MTSEANRITTHRIPSAVWALGCVSLLMDVSSEMIHSLLPVFLVSGLGASALTLGLIEGAGEATGLVVRAFSGALSDFWGRRKPLAVLGYGLGALSKPLFALATGAGLVLLARVVDRVGKGIRGAPRDALVVDVTPPTVRGAAFGLRQALDTVGAFLGPALALGLMLLWADDFRAVFAVAIVPGVAAVALLAIAVREPGPARPAGGRRRLRWRDLGRLPAAYWWVVVIGAAFGLARFSEAFLVLRARDAGLALAWTPLVLIAMNAVYALAAYPAGRLADRVSHARLLALGLVVLLAADALLALSPGGGSVWGGIGLWGLHMGLTQGLLAAMVADTAPAELRGTAYGFFNLLSGLALLVASGLAGLVWDWFGPSRTFVVGAGFGLVTLLALLARGRDMRSLGA